VRGQPTHRQYALAEGRELPPAQVVNLDTRPCLHPLAMRNNFRSAEGCHGIEFDCEGCRERVVILEPPTKPLVLDFYLGDGRVVTITLGPAMT